MNLARKYATFHLDDNLGGCFSLMSKLLALRILTSYFEDLSTYRPLLWFKPLHGSQHLALRIPQK